MSEASDRAFREALTALRERRFDQAAGFFREAASGLDGDADYLLMAETTNLLLAVKEEIARQSGLQDETIEIEEMFTHG